MLKSLAFAGAIVCALFFASGADARQRHKASGLHPECNVTMPCAAPSASTAEQARVTRGRYIARQLGFGAAIERREIKTDRRGSKARPVSAAQPAVMSRFAARSEGAGIVAHPSGCPARAFCGCGAAERLKSVWGVAFALPTRSLWLAANWYRFPRTSPGAGMVAVRRHHVFVLEQHLSGDRWLAYDANSGGHATRIHVRSIAGYTIVDPRGGAA